MREARTDYVVLTGIIYLSVSPWLIGNPSLRLLTLCALLAISFTRAVRNRAQIPISVVVLSLIMACLLIVTPLLTGDNNPSPYLTIIVLIVLGVTLACTIQLDRFLRVFTRIVITLAAASLLLTAVGTTLPVWLANLPTFSGEFVDYRIAGVHNFIAIRDAGAATELLNRNSGIAWEPGAFAVLLCLALAFLCHEIKRVGPSLTRGLALSVLVAAVLTTISLSGYIGLIIILVAYWRSWLSSGTWLPVALGGLLLAALMSQGHSGLDLAFDRVSQGYGSGEAQDRISINLIGYVAGAPWFPLGSSYSWYLEDQARLWNSVLASIAALGVPFVVLLQAQYLRFASYFRGQAWAVATVMVLFCSVENFYVSPLFIAFGMFGAFASWRTPQGRTRHEPARSPRANVPKAANEIVTDGGQIAVE